MSKKKRIKNSDADERVQQTGAAAKKSVAQRGNVEFRLDEETMLRLMKLADAKKMPLGVLARQWTEERLNEEEKELCTKIVKVEDTPPTKESSDSDHLEPGNWVQRHPDPNGWVSRHGSKAFD